uniref:Integrin subunit alpha L n=1 Tax=Nomascus leucogenys TaxID=61853 RepID=A0A2I3G3K3_NOMLE
MKDSCITVMAMELLSGFFFFGSARLELHLDVRGARSFSPPLNITICFQIKSLIPQFQGHLVANLTYTLQLDGHRTRRRGLFPGGRHELRRNMAVTTSMSCTDFSFHFPMIFNTVVNSSWGDSVELHANVTCNNEDSGLLEDNSATTIIPILYPINVLIQDQENSTLYVSFTPKGPKIHQVKHIYQVRIQTSIHDHNIPTLEAVVGVPQPPSEGPITHQWSVQMEPPVPCHYEDLKRLPDAAEPCLPGALFRCPVVFRQDILVQVIGTLELVGEIEASSMFSLCSSLSISFNSSKHFHLYGSNAPLAQVVMKVDVVYEKQMLYLYVLSGIGGLLLLLLIFIVLYKVGFFKRNLKEKMEAGGGVPNGIPAEDSEQLASGEEAGDPGCLKPLHEKDSESGDGKD